MSVVSHIAAQRTNHGVPHAVSCRLLGVSESWFYKWRSRRPTATERRRAALDVRVRIVFETSGRTYGSPGFVPSCAPTVNGSQKDRGPVYAHPRPGSTAETAPARADPPRQSRSCGA